MSDNSVESLPSTELHTTKSSETTPGKNGGIMKMMMRPRPEDTTEKDADKDVQARMPQLAKTSSLLSISTTIDEIDEDGEEDEKDSQEQINILKSQIAELETISAAQAHLVSSLLVEKELFEKRIIVLEGEVSAAKLPVQTSQTQTPSFTVEDANLFYSDNQDYATAFAHLVAKLSSRKHAERLISLCQCNPCLANQLAFLCNWNLFQCEVFLRMFEHNCEQVISLLKFFRGSPTQALAFLQRFKGTPKQANVFLNKFDFDVEKMESFLNKLNGDSQLAYLQSSVFNFDEGIVNIYNELIGITNLMLLYDTLIHPKSSEEFHTRVDMCGPTVTFIIAENIICGGIAFSSWKEPVHEWTAIADTKASLFSLVNRVLDSKPGSFPIEPEKSPQALYSYFGRGPCFGIGCDLCTYFTTNSPTGIQGWSTPSTYSIDADTMFAKPETETVVERIVVFGFR